MPFEEGREKTGGRVVGTPNKFKLLTVREACEKYELDPICEIIKILQDKKPPHLQKHQCLSAYQSIVAYLTPRPKTDEGKGKEPFSTPLSEEKTEKLVNEIENANNSGQKTEGHQG